jgi:hypothetical protein
MKKRGGMVVGVLAFAMAVMVGCEWEWADDENSWNSRVAWLNFSGVYEGMTAVLPTNGVVAPSGSLQEVRNEVVGIGNGSDRFFAGTLSGRPLYPGTLTITDGTESFVDGGGTGSLTGDQGGSGSVNYNTGVFNVTFQLQPAPGVQVRATYLYYTGGGGGSTTPTTPSDTTITRMTVQQDGNVLFMTDNGGKTYRGKLSRVISTAGDMSGNSSGDIIANFEAEGSDLRLVGTFEGQYVAPEADGVRGVLFNVFMRGTWINASGASGNFNFESARRSVNVFIAPSTNPPSSGM